MLYAASFSITAEVQPGDPGVILESMFPFMASCPVSHQVLAVPSPEPRSPIPSLLRWPPRQLVQAAVFPIFQAPASPMAELLQDPALCSQ